MTIQFPRAINEHTEQTVETHRVCKVLWQQQFSWAAS